MKTTSKRICLALILVLAVAVAVPVLWKKQTLPQIVTLQNGQRYRYAGVTYGTNHVQPTMVARVLNRMPLSLASLVQRKLGKHLDPINSFTSTEPLLVLWFQRLTTNAVPYGQFLHDHFPAKFADRNGVVAGFKSSDDPWGGRWENDHSIYDVLRLAHSAEWPVAAFGLVAPRRSPTLQCVLFEYLPGGATCREAGRVSFSNPFYGRFPQWQPEPVPAAKLAGDLEVRLDKLMVGAYGQMVVLADGSRGLDYRPPKPGEDIWTAFDLSLKSTRGTNEAWQIESVDLSDATGNHIHATGHFDSLIGDGAYRNAIKGALWPDESAWRLKLELKRKSGFSLAELVTFSNVPLLRSGATKALCLTNAGGSAQIVLTESLGGLDTPEFRIQIPNGPDGVSLGFVQMTTDAGAEANADEITVARLNSAGFHDATGAYRCVRLARFPAGVGQASVRTVDITWAVQKTRTVEFLVKPPKMEW